jgi:hypothetical protein
MPRFFALATISGLLMAAQWSCSVMPASAADAEEGFKRMFNGKDLTDWQGEPGYWSVQDGTITGQTTKQKPLDHPTYMYWRGGRPHNFELRATYRFQGSFGNSGINFRSEELPHWDIRGYQADMEVGPGCSGTLYECNGRQVMTVRGQLLVIGEDGRRKVTTLAPAAELQKLIHPNDWNECAVIARGPEIIIKINGVVMSDVIDRNGAWDGLISLQLHPGPPMKVQFKNIRIKDFFD